MHYGHGKYRIWALQEKLGKDIVLRVGGGERPHVGSIILCRPGKESKVLSLVGHMDHVIGRPIAEKLCRKKKATVVCVCGVHVDKASKDEIDRLVENGRGLLKMI